MLLRSRIEQLNANYKYAQGILFNYIYPTYSCLAKNQPTSVRTRSQHKVASFDQFHPFSALIFARLSSHSPLPSSRLLSISSSFRTYPFSAKIPKVDPASIPL